VEVLRVTNNGIGNGTSTRTLSPQKQHKESGHDPRYPAPILKLRNNEDNEDEEEDEGGYLGENQSTTTGKHSSVTKGTGINSLMMFNDPAGGGKKTAGNNNNDATRGRSRLSMKKRRQNHQDKEKLSHSPDTDSQKKSKKDRDRENNTDLPTITFTGGDAYGNDDEEGEGEGEGGGDTEGEAVSPSNHERDSPANGGDQATANNNHRKKQRNKGLSKSQDFQNALRQSKEMKKEALRTDKNEKAKFGKLPPGKFRREFSLDHPLAPNGSGKYIKELQKGLKPVGIFLNPIQRQNQDIEATLFLADKMERLTYEAQTSILEKTLDENNDKSIAANMEATKKQLNGKLEDLIEEERIAEEERIEHLQKISDPQEKYNMELIFAEERTRASDRIIALTKENDSVMKKELLKTMKLGTQLQNV
jgi:hypothetical protein